MRGSREISLVPSLHDKATQDIGRLLPSRKNRSESVSTVSQHGRVVNRHMNQDVMYIRG